MNRKIRLWDAVAFALGSLASPWVMMIWPFESNVKFKAFAVLLLGGIAIVVVRFAMPWTNKSAPQWPRLVVVVPLALVGLAMATVADLKAYYIVTDKPDLYPDTPGVQIRYDCNQEGLDKRTCVINGSMVEGRECYTAKEMEVLEADIAKARVACEAENHRRKEEETRAHAIEMRRQQQEDRREDARTLKMTGKLAIGALASLCLAAFLDWQWRRIRPQKW